MMVCTGCGCNLPDTRFYRRKERGGQLYRHCKDCHRRLTSAWINARPETRRAYSRQWGKRLRIRTLRVVARSRNPQCSCCGETEVDFLVIDHMNGGGSKESASYGNHREFYQGIVQGKRDTSDLQILCANCNTAKGRAGTCPHHRVRREGVPAAAGIAR